MTEGKEKTRETEREKQKNKNNSNWWILIIYNDRLRQIRMTDFVQIEILIQYDSS